MQRIFDTPPESPARSKMTGVALTVSTVATLILIAAPLGSREGLYHFRTGFAMMAAATGGAALGGVLALSVLIMTARAKQWRSFSIAGFALVLSLVTVAIPLALKQKAQSVPAIHDITTDTGFPPAFVAILERRKDAANPPAYAGPEAAALQKQAYPDVEPLLLQVPVSGAYELALQAAHDSGWEIVAVSQVEGRIEATDTTRFWGFKDDIVVRISGQGHESRIDVRSKSRVGKSDVGANAERILKYLERIRNSRL